jgi:hypothetical protein
VSWDATELSRLDSVCDLLIYSKLLDLLADASLCCRAPCAASTSCALRRLARIVWQAPVHLLSYDQLTQSLYTSAGCMLIRSM